MTGESGRARNILVYVASQAPLHAINAANVLILARLLGTEAFGIYATISTLMWSLSVLVEDGLATAITRETARAPDSATRWLTNGLVLALLTGLATSAAMAVLGLLLGYPSTVLQVLPLAALALWLRAPWITVTGGLNGRERFIHSSALMLGATALNAVLGIWLVVLGYGVAGVFAGTVAANLLATGLSLMVASRVLPPLSMRALTRGELVEVARSVLPFGLRALAAMVYFRADAVMLSVIKGFESVGLYRAGFSLFSLAIVLPGVASQALLPMQARLHGESRERLREVFERQAAVFVGLGVAVGVMLAAFAEPLVRTLYGMEYQRSAPVLAVLGAAAALLYIAAPVTTVLVSGSDQRRVTVLALLGVASNLALNFWLIPPYAELGSALASLGSATVTVLLAVLAVDVYIPRLAIIGYLARLLAGSVLAAGAAVLLTAVSVWLLPLAMVAYAAIYEISLPPSRRILVWLRSWIATRDRPRWAE